MSLSSCRNAVSVGESDCAEGRPVLLGGRVCLIGGAVSRLRNSKAISLGQVTGVSLIDSTRRGSGLGELNCRRQLWERTGGVVVAQRLASWLARWLARRG